ncbi:MAG: MBL fold metallo-hydrolase [Halobacteriales archaeon]
MNIRFLGGCREVGRSALYVDTSLLLDYGVKAGTPNLYPVSRPKPDAVVASHGHLDHVGAIPRLMDRLPEVHATAPTHSLARLLAEDTLEIKRRGLWPFSPEDVLRLSQTARVHGYEEFEVAGYEAELRDAGHIPGSASVLVDDGDTRLFYTGDLNTTPTRLCRSAERPPEADAVVLESTYFGHHHTPRDELEREFARSVRETLYEGGDVVIPAFAIGRTQEVLMVLHEHDVPCYVDGMGREVTGILRSHPEMVRDADALKRAWNHAREVRPGERDRVLGQGRAVVTTSGMMTGGPVNYYVRRIHDDPVNKICLTGYQVAGTPGREAFESKRAEVGGDVLPISAQVELHDFSAHADDGGLKEYARHAVDAGADEFYVVHGDERETQAFANWIERELDVDARAPAPGEEVEV